MSFFADRRDSNPRLKPGITYTRLIIFLVVIAVLVVAAEHFASGTSPTSDCDAKEIDRGARKEGTCMEGNATIVVVNRHSPLKLESLEARLLGIDERKTIEGPTGSKTSKGDFVTFDLAVSNRTDAPVAVTSGQFVLFAGEIHAEDVEVEEGYERRSFTARRREILPQATEKGTVTFALSAKGAAAVRTEGNLDIVNLGSSVSSLEPEAIFTEPEYGVIRTYR